MTVPRNRRRDRIELVIIAVMLLGFLAAGLTGLARGQEARLFLGLASLGLGAAEVFRLYLRRRKIESATIYVRPWPLRLGDRVTAEFTSRLRDTRVTSQLLCIEETRHSMGKYETVKRAVRYSSSIDSSRDQWEFDIPATGLPSFTASSNKVQWLVRATIRTDKVEIPGDFELVVIPEVVS